MLGSANNDSHNKNKKLSDTSGKKLYVKYMVCLRDKIVLKSVLDNIGFEYEITVHDAIHFLEEYTEVEYQELKRSLSKYGLILLDEHESMLIERIIQTIVQVIHYSDQLPKIKFSDLVSDYAGKESDSILKIFSDVKGMSIVQFIIMHKIERAKEILLYEDVPVSEIAELLNYRNKHYLLAQFKKVTGLSPHDFKRMKKARQTIAEKYSNDQNPGISKAGT